MYSRAGRIQEEAVSPIIGTLLILAITIVLIAVICGVALGFFSGMFSAKNVGATLTPYETQSEYGMEFLMYSGADAKNITSVRVLADGVTFAWNGASFVKNPQIGVSYRFNVTGITAGVLGSNAIVTAVGTFADGEEVVLVQTRMTVLGDGNSDVVVTEKGYLKVMFGTYSNTTPVSDTVGVIPGRGVYVRILEKNKSVTGVNLIKIYQLPRSVGVQIYTPNSGNKLQDVSAPADNVNYYFYANVTYDKNNPYNEQNINPEIYNLELKANFTLKLGDGTTTDEVQRQSVKLPARQVIFDIPEIVEGTISSAGPKSLDVDITKMTLTGGSRSLEVWVVPAGSSAYCVYSEGVASTGQVQKTISMNKEARKLDEEATGTGVDVLIEKNTGNGQWSAWYRVGSTTVGALRGT